MTQYALVAALVVLVLVGLLANIGAGLQHVFCEVNAGFHPLTTSSCVVVVR
jgi:Flp pilus assembly pilin Flp